jgi:Asp-tRNA(Asn)/Glu-tRNA(Gln) amidotransferase A subunit family amidase
MTVKLDGDDGGDAVSVAGGYPDPGEAIVACLARIRATEPRIHAFRDVIDDDAALAAVCRLDPSTNARSSLTLRGVPIAVKEVIDVRGMRCTWGTAIHADRIPEQDAEVVGQLRAAGAIVVGTTISTEYAIARPGPTVNPWDEARTPGGSSSGSAAAVAAGMVPLALGTQTIGSLVRPATYCGVYALKPTRGAIATRGVMPLSAALDHVGIFSRTHRDLARAWGVLRGKGGTTAEITPTGAPAVIVVDGYPRESVGPASQTAVERAIASFRAVGVEVGYAQLPNIVVRGEESLDITLCHDLAIHHGGDRDRYGARMSTRLLELIERGRAISETQYASALDHAEQVRVAIEGLLRSGSVLLAPATDGVAPCRDEYGTGSPRLQGIYSLVGLPTLAAPCGKIDGLPIGVQLVAGSGREDRLLAAAAALELGWIGGSVRR